jgi:hypothetical protein
VGAWGGADGGASGDLFDLLDAKEQARVTYIQALNPRPESNHTFS